MNTLTSTSPPPATRNHAGFTLIEALLTIVVVALMATAISGLYISGMRSLDVQARRVLLQGHLRSQMELLVGTPFNHLTSGSRAIDVATGNQTNTYTISWTISPIDLDGDSTPEPDAKQVKVALEGQALTMLLTDHQGRVKKL